MNSIVKVYYNNNPIKNLGALASKNEKALLKKLRKNSFIKTNLTAFNFEKPSHSIINQEQRYGYLNSGPWTILWKPQAQSSRLNSNWLDIIKYNPLLFLNSLLFVLTLCATLELLHRILMNYI